MQDIILVILLVIFIQVSYLIFIGRKHRTRSKTIRPIFVDTSVLIDGRILTVLGSGFISGDLLIPRSVVGELQFMADNADGEKRSRARYGLDVIAQLQAIDSQAKVKIFADGLRPKDGVDNRLIELAKTHRGVICTIDYNLNKVAQVEGLVVLNINDLAMGLRMAYLPGERMLLELNDKGNSPDQAISHLSDGTMVVVEKAGSQIGKIVEVEFIKSLQTAAGRMMFAKLVRAPKPKNNQTNYRANGSNKRNKN